jgi:hypothetical protein
MAPFRIAILWRGDREARRTASAQNNRYHRDGSYGSWLCKNGPAEA